MQVAASEKQEQVWLEHVRSCVYLVASKVNDKNMFSFLLLFLLLPLFLFSFSFSFSAVART